MSSRAAVDRAASFSAPFFPGIQPLQEVTRNLDVRADYTTFTNLEQAVPLASDRDLVQELNTLTPGQLKPIFARYNRTGRDDGTTPVVFADGHAKMIQAKRIANGSSGIIWRFR